MGDLNGAGFGDDALWLPVFSSDAGCTDPAGEVPIIYYGAEDLSAPETQPVCAAAGSTATVNYPRDVGDVNGDGFDDLGITWSFVGSEYLIRVFPGGQQVGSSAIVDVPTNGSGAWFSSYLSQQMVGRGDYNGDGYSDVVAGGVKAAIPNEVYVIHGGPDFISQAAHTLETETCDSTHWISSAGDVNEDGLDDFAFACGEQTAGGTFFVLEGGTNNPAEFSNVWQTTDFDFESVTPYLDFDNNGEREFLLGIDGESAVIWRMDLSDGPEPQRFTRFSSSSWIDVADHNGNGRGDLLLSSAYGASWAGSSTTFAVLVNSLTFPDEFDRIQF
jgi:hypothetical protein